MVEYSLFWGKTLKKTKHVGKKTLETHQSCSMQKMAPKNNSYSKQDKILKSGQNGHFAKAKWSKMVYFGDKHKSDKNLRKTTLETHQSNCWSMQKMILKCDSYLKNDAVLKRS